MPSMDSVVTNIGDVRPHTRKVCKEIAGLRTLYFIWGIGPSGEHAEGRALDFMTYRLGGGVDTPGPIRIQLGWEIGRYLWKHRKRLGVWYVIYRRQIISINDNSYGPSGTWNRMPDRGDPTANHMDHVHVSFRNHPPTYEPPEDDMPTAKEIARAVLKRKVQFGPTQTRIAGLEEGHRTTFENAVKIGAANSLWARRKGIPEVLDLIRQLAELTGKPMSDEERERLAAAIADKADRLRDELSAADDEDNEDAEDDEDDEVDEKR